MSSLDSSRIPHHKSLRLLSNQGSLFKELLLLPPIFRNLICNLSPFPHISHSSIPRNSHRCKPQSSHKCNPSHNFQRSPILVCTPPWNSLLHHFHARMRKYTSSRQPMKERPRNIIPHFFHWRLGRARVKCEIVSEGVSKEVCNRGCACDREEDGGDVVEEEIVYCGKEAETGREDVLVEFGDFEG